MTDIIGHLDIYPATAEIVTPEAMSVTVRTHDPLTRPTDYPGVRVKSIYAERLSDTDWKVTWLYEAA
jgi:hypothetical protein